MSRRMNLVPVPGPAGTAVPRSNARPPGPNVGFNSQVNRQTQPKVNVDNNKPTDPVSKPVHRQFTRTLLMMPDDILTIVLAKLSYDEISQLRVVCHRFNRICQRLLNQGLQRLERYHGDCLKKLKSQLPRRESERRQHPLARHCDILSAVETRLSLLAMTYSKYIDLKVCCFIPGKVIDEAMEVLRFVMQSKEAPRTHDLLQELRDISSMAMEHFDEKIAPGLKKKLGENHAVNVNTIGAALKEFSSKGGPMVPSTSVGQLGRMQTQLKAANYSFHEVVKEVKALKAHVAELRKVRYEQDRKITHQQQVVVELTSKVTSQSERIAEQERKMALFEQQLRNAPGPSGEPVFFTIDEVQGDVSEEKNEEGVKVEGSDDTSEATGEEEEGPASQGNGGDSDETGQKAAEVKQEAGTSASETQSTTDTESATEVEPATTGRGRKRRSVNEVQNPEDSIASGTKKRTRRSK